MAAGSRGAVAIFRNVEFLMLVVFDAYTVLSAPAVPLSVNPAPFHEHRIYTRLPTQKNGPEAGRLAPKHTSGRLWPPEGH